LEDVIWTVAKKIDIILRSNYPPKTCLASLAEKMDIDRWTLFSLSGYGGNKPTLGRIEGNEFRLHKRRYWHNSFAPVLFGRVTEDGRGTVVEAYWATWRGPRVFIRIWLGLAIILGTPIFLASVRDAIRFQSSAHDDLWIGLVVPIGLVLWGFLFPLLGAALGTHEKEPVLRLLEQTILAARVPTPIRDRSWKTSLDSWIG
jgi:hypothetical protein